MSNVDKIKEFMTKYGVHKDDVWQVKGGKNYAITHAAIERIAFQHNVTFGLPTIIEADSANKIATVLVTGKLGDFEQWSIGEASPNNNKNDYPFAMAEKRAKDRVVLKLLNIHGLLYSEEEAEAFTEKSAPLRTTKSENVELPKSASQMTPAEIASTVQKREPIHVKPAEPDRDPTEIEAFKTLMKMVESVPSAELLKSIHENDEWKATIELVHTEDRSQLRKAYAERLTTLSYKEAS